MKSELMQMSGTAAFSLRIRDLYSSTVWLRFIAASTRSEPDCTGRWMNFTSSGTSAWAWISASENSSGCEVV
ncbi:Uncharacterised protein [Klebsiella pneumoniae]|nr:hypothetical protein PAERUG_E16_London_17_VIM_2_04_14_03053 [Pseudomonas aeruginosa]SSI76320.1 Uncharacterised protein [Klebsiella pneumoniae]